MLLLLLVILLLLGAIPAGRTYGPRAVVAIILIIVLVGGLPEWGYHPYGYYPLGGGLGLILLVLLVLYLTERL